MRDIIHIDLFSGILGFRLALEQAGFNIAKHYYSDIEKYPLELSKKRFPSSIPLGDVTKIDWESLNKEVKAESDCDIIVTGGFP